MMDEHTKPLLDKALSTYPLYEPKSKNEFIPNLIPTREELNKKLLNAYKYREIGFETIGRFLDELEIAMCEIMPYYNQIFFTQDQDFNIIYNVDYTKTTDIERSSTTSGTSSGTNTGSATNINITTNSSNTTTEREETNATDNKTVGSKTPQDSLSITGADIDKVTYADDVEWNKNNINTNESGTSNTAFDSTSDSTHTTNDESSREHSEDSEGSEGITEIIKGNFGVVSAQDLVKKYREIIMNTVQVIINDKRIKELFMNVY